MTLIPLSPQAEQKEDDEHFANHLQIYVSKTFTKTKKICIMRRIPLQWAQNSIYPNGKHIFTIYW